jgi:hypothetical protein
MAKATRVLSTPRKTEFKSLRIVAGTTAPPADPYEAFFKQHDPRCAPSTRIGRRPRSTTTP